MRAKSVLVSAALVAPAVVAVVGCSSVPVTGRRSLDLVDDAALVAESRQMFEALKRQYRVSKDPTMNATLRRVCDRLVESLPFWDMPLAEWEFVVFDDPNTVNAFAMPGGKIAVFSGTFSVATTDDQLAVILAHEIAHVTAKHVHERLSQQMLSNAGGQTLDLLTGGIAGLGLVQAYQLGADMVGLSFDRKKESEADYMGLIYMARAGFNPRAAIELWEKMDQVMIGRRAPAEWQSTHPSHENRLAQLYGWMTEAEAEYEKALGKNPPS